MLPPDPPVVGLYITACASVTSTGDKKPNSVSTIERRLSSLTWNYAQRGQPLDRKDRHIATVLAGIRNRHASPPRQKEAVLPEDLIAMLETLDCGTLRGLRDRAMLLGSTVIRPVRGQALRPSGVRETHARAPAAQARAPSRMRREHRQRG